MPHSESALRDRPADFRELRGRFGSAAFKPLFSRALSELERDAGSAASCELLIAAEQSPESRRSHVIGVTGPPGVGKSSLIGALVRHWRKAGRSVGVIAVDPSSAQSGGALLGDRTRLAGDPHDALVFVRSMATRGRLGGLSVHSYPAIVAMRAFFDRVVVETVGVGQSEIEVRRAVDTVLLCVQPGAGDALQFMKAGIGEIPDLIAVTKSDVGAAAQQALGALSSTAGLARGPSWSAAALSVSARSGSGLAELCQELDRHQSWLDEHGRILAQRESQTLAAVEEGIRERWGRERLEALMQATGEPAASPYELWRRAARFSGG